MKKVNYIRPLVEVIELNSQDIITTSFSKTVDGGLVGGIEVKKGNYNLNEKAKVIGGKLVLE